MKSCSKCDRTLRSFGFYKSSTSLDGLRSHCKACDKGYADDWRKANPEKVRIREQAWRKAHPERVKHWNKAWRKANPERAKALPRAWRQADPKRARASERDSRYGLDKGEYQGILAKQNGCCAICRQSMKPANIDHDHDTKKIRGLLCRRCNLGLGLFKDSEIALVAAAEYLRKSKEQT